MLDRLRKQLTLLCILITGLILIAISLFSYLFVERELNKRSFLSLKSQSVSISEHVQSEHCISHSWLNQTEASNKMIISICGKNSSFLFQGNYKSAQRDHLIEKARQIGLKNYHFDALSTYISTYDTPSISFSIRENSEHYIAIITTFIQADRHYELIILKNMCNDDAEILFLRIIFIGSVLLGIFLLGLFSWWFVGNAIRPIKVSRQEQVDFVAAASHELRSPIAVIEAVTEDILEGGGNLVPNDGLHTIHNECNRLGRLVGDLLLLARADSGKWSIHKQPTEIDTLLLNVYDKYLPLVESHHQKLDITLANDVDNPISIDYERIEQVLSILLDNAMNYTPPHTLILLKLEKTVHKINIWVIDNGPGIPLTSYPHIFKRFYRVDAARQSDKHTGLGLSIAYEIIKLHNGHLSLDPSYHNGCAFKISLPIS